MKCLDRSLGGRHPHKFDKAATLMHSSPSVSQNHDLCDLAELLEDLSHPVLLKSLGDLADEELYHRLLRHSWWNSEV